MNPRRRLDRDFFSRHPLVCSRDLIGCVLRVGECAGIVVETEAYCSEGDEASHTFFRPSARKFIADHQPGSAYVYMNYGVHWLANVMTRDHGMEGFVLLRALEPLEGIPLMRKRRKLEALTALTSGPGKLTKALGLDGSFHGGDFCEGDYARFEARAREPRIVEGPRVGITRSVDLPWRFSEAGNPHVSKGPVLGGRK